MSHPLAAVRSSMRTLSRTAQCPRRSGIVSSSIHAPATPRPRWRANLHSTPSNTVQPTIASHSAASAIAAPYPERAESYAPQPPLRPLSKSQQDFLDSALRVNQAGELAAVLIYAAQTPPLLRSHPHLRGLMKHMYDQEAGHFTYFNALLAKHRIRPTAMYPVWHAAATMLGWGTAVMGREAAMACTEAVETEIGSHYNEQVRVLLDWAGKLEARGETLGEELTTLIGHLRRIRDEELEHLDHAVENDSKDAKPYDLLTNVIRGGCRTAIWISERI